MARQQAPPVRHRRRRRTAGTAAGWHRNAELAPEALRIEPHTLECVPEHPVEKDDLARRRDDDAAGADGSVSEAGCRVQGSERGKDLEQEPERGIDAGRGRLIEGFTQAFKDVREPIAGHELRDDDDTAGAGVAFQARGCAKRSSSNNSAEFESLADRTFECANSARRWRRSRMPPVSRSNVRVRTPRPSLYPDVERDAGNEGGGTDISGVIASLQPALH